MSKVNQVLVKFWPTTIGQRIFLVFTQPDFGGLSNIAKFFVDGFIDMCLCVFIVIDIIGYVWDQSETWLDQPVGPGKRFSHSFFLISIDPNDPL